MIRTRLARFSFLDRRIEPSILERVHIPTINQPRSSLRKACVTLLRGTHQWLHVRMGVEGSICHHEMAVGCQRYVCFRTELCKSLLPCHLISLKDLSLVLGS